MWLPQDTGSQKQYVDEERCDEGVIYGRKSFVLDEAWLLMNLCMHWEEGGWRRRWEDALDTLLGNELNRETKGKKKKRKSREGMLPRLRPPIPTTDEPVCQAEATRQIYRAD